MRLPHLGNLEPETGNTVTNSFLFPTRREFILSCIQSTHTFLFLFLSYSPFSPYILSQFAVHLRTCDDDRCVINSIMLVTLNANGIRRATKRRAIFADLHKSGADIVLFQETHSTHSTQADLGIWLSELGGEGRFSHGRSNSRGVAILFKRGYTFKIVEEVTAQEGRFLAVV